MNNRLRVLVNPRANGGKGRRRWAAVDEGLRRGGATVDAVIPDSLEEAEKRLGRMFDEEVDCVAAGGGDGTVHLVLNAIMKRFADAPDRRPVLGAVGLGSSNDFHKPILKTSRVGNVPVALDTSQARAIDIGRVECVSPDGGSEVKYFCLNGSIGFVADSNHYFNSDRAILRALKNINVELAIIYTAISNLMGLSTTTIELGLDGRVEPDRVLTNLSVLKKVYLAGGMKYDTEVSCDDASFDVAIWDEMNRRDVVKTIVGLYREKFSGRPKHQVCRAREVTIKSSQPVNLELDGEVGPVRSARFEVVPKAIRICGGGYGTSS
ncbi:MAG: diacylglycerol kinase family protein [Verrucomicrobiota bacterium]